MRRTWPQRLLVGANLGVVSACLLAAFGLWYGNNRLGELERVVITHDQSTLSHDASAATGTTEPTVSGSGGAQNFLLVGSDSRACIDPTSPYAGAFTDGSYGGQRSDSIMMLRVDPSANAAAILSFPRDLWVKIAGTGRSQRINTAFNHDDPSQLVKTIELNFGLRTDHYLEVDFCAFKHLVDDVGGVKVPFALPTRDRNTGLNVTAPGCVLLSGDAALAYVRSREYQVNDGKGWKYDPSSDYGRIRRQQDFIRRVMQKAIDRGARNPAVLKSLIDTAVKDVRVDDQLTVSDLFDLGNRLRDFDPGTVQAYTIEGVGTVIGGAAVIRPTLDAPQTKQVLQIFSGKAKLVGATTPTTNPADASTTAASSTTSTTLAPTTTTRRNGSGSGGTARTTTSTTSTTLDPATLPTVVVPTTVGLGILPPNDPTCR